MLQDESTDSFTTFIEDVEPRLRRALTSRFGTDVGWDATADALAYAWEHWSQLHTMENPAGYLYRVASNRAKSIVARRRTPFFPAPPVERVPWFEPKLLGALESLPPKQRTVVMLIYGYGYSMSEVADVLGISKASVQKHAERAMARLRRKLRVDA